MNHVCTKFGAKITFFPKVIVWTDGRTDGQTDRHTQTFTQPTDCSTFTWSRGSASLVNGNWEMAIFDPSPHYPHPLTDHQNLLQVITSATPTAVPNLVQIHPWSTGDFWANGWNITNFIYLFRELIYRSDPSTAFMLDGSNEFAGLVDTVPNFKGEIPKKNNFGGRKCLPLWCVQTEKLLLRNRRFRFHVGYDVSSWRMQANGLPQGCVLALTLFNLLCQWPSCHT